MEEKRRIILEHCQKHPDHWVRVYFEDGHNMKVKAGELAELVNSGKINLASVREVEDLTIANRPMKPMPPSKFRIPKIYESMGGGSGNSSTNKSDDKPKDEKVLGVMVGVLVVLVVLGLLLRR